MTSKASLWFGKQFYHLPQPVQELACKNYLPRLKNARQPSIQFKPFHGRSYSARVGDHCRAVGYFSALDEFAWVWMAATRITTSSGADSKMKL